MVGKESVKDEEKASSDSTHEVTPLEGTGGTCTWTCVCGRGVWEPV